MDRDELLADTNRLLQRLVEIEREQRADAERSRAELQERLDRSREASERALSSKLREQGLPEELAAGSVESWENRHQDVQRRISENLEASRLKDEQYRDDLLRELKIQSDLLRQIAEKIAP